MSSPTPTAPASLHLRLPAVSWERFVRTTCLFFSFFQKELAGTCSAPEKRWERLLEERKQISKQTFFKFFFFTSYTGIVGKISVGYCWGSSCLMWVQFRCIVGVKWLTVTNWTVDQTISFLIWLLKIYFRVRSRRAPVCRSCSLEVTLLSNWQRRSPAPSKARSALSFCAHTGGQYCNSQLRRDKLANTYDSYKH